MKQQASNETAGYYVFQNIRFAAPPLGNLRLRRPQPPRRERTARNGVYPYSTACESAEDCLVCSHPSFLIHSFLTPS